MSREKSIRLSSKNGLNPTISVCPYCGKDKGILLMGALGDKLARKMGRENGEMPMYTRFGGDYEPCRECAEKGVVVLVLDHEPVKGEKPDIVDSKLLDRRVVPFLVHPDEMAERILKFGRMFVDRKTADKLDMSVAEIKAMLKARKEGPEDDH